MSFTPQQYLAAVRESFLYNDRSMGLEKKWLATDVARCIEAADPDKLVFVIDWDSEISFNPDNKEAHNAVPVWQASEYRSTYEQHLIGKELSEKERQHSYRHVELRNSLRKKFIAKFYSTGVDPKNKETIEEAMNLLISSRAPGVAEMFGISFAELCKADEDLQEFKRRNKIK